MRFLLATVVVASIFLVVGPSLAGFGAPPVITIYTFPDMVEVSELSIPVSEPFSLIAQCIGDFPMTYKWQSDEDSIGNSMLLLDYVCSIPTEYEVLFEATDTYGDRGSCSVMVT